MATHIPLKNRIKDPTKPKQLRAIFGIFLFKIALSFTAFIVFTVQNKTIGDVGPQLILYTALGYVATWLMLAYFIVNKNITGMRVVIFIDLLISLPAKAYIALVLGVVAFLLSFHKNVKAWVSKPF